MLFSLQALKENSEKHEILESSIMESETETQEDAALMKQLRKTQQRQQEAKDDLRITSKGDMN